LHNICLDATGIVNFPTGLGKYTYHIVKGVTTCRNFHYTILYQRSLVKDHPLFGLASRAITFVPLDSPVIGPRRELIFTLLRRMISHKDLFHCLSSYLPAFGLDVPTIITVHDLKYLLFPQLLGSRMKAAYYSWIVQRGMHKATHIIAVSESTKKDIVRLGFDSIKIKVIHEANTLEYDEKTDSIPSGIADKPYMLFVGEDRPHKNIDRLLKAHRVLYDRMGARCPRLVIAGPASKRFAKSDSEITEKSNHIFVGPVDDRALLQLYRNALALVYPSLYEGFGLPILEAMAAGIPVITSNCSAMAEVAGGAAILVDPRSIDQIEQAMARITLDPEERSRLRKLSLSHVRRYSWKKAALSTLQLYEEVISATA
jgi:glycosyltransferase involved in cell wall biosynthesis